jgi:hypothetical protein
MLIFWLFRDIITKKDSFKDGGEFEKNRRESKN